MVTTLINQMDPLDVCRAFISTVICVLDFQLVILQQEEFFQYVLTFVALLILLLKYAQCHSFFKITQNFQL